jgi:hypothetical protein
MGSSEGPRDDVIIGRLRMLLLLPLFVGTTYHAFCFLIATIYESMVLKRYNGLMLSWRTLLEICSCEKVR